MTCQCLGRYPGCEAHQGFKCTRKAGAGWSRYFCVQCGGNRWRWLSEQQEDPGNSSAGMVR